MRRTTTVWIALALTACGGGATTAPGKPSEAQGAEAPITVADRIAPRDLVASARSFPVVGPILSDEAQGYAIQIELANRGRHPIATEGVWSRVSVYRDGVVIPGCRAQPARIAMPPLRIDPGGTASLVTSLPCGLLDPGDYDVAIDVVLGTPQHGDPPADPIIETTATRVTIDDRLPLFGREARTPEVATPETVAPSP